MDIQAMMKQAQEIQARMQAMQADLEQREVQAESGGGMVKVTMTCRGEVRAMDISPEIISADQKETLEDLVTAALNAARRNADDMLARETQKMMEELGLPGDINLPGM